MVRECTPQTCLSVRTIAPSCVLFFDLKFTFDCLLPVMFITIKKIQESCPNLDARAWDLLEDYKICRAEVEYSPCSTLAKLNQHY